MPGPPADRAASDRTVATWCGNFSPRDSRCRPTSDLVPDYHGAVGGNGDAKACGEPKFELQMHHDMVARPRRRGDRASAPRPCYWLPLADIIPRVPRPGTCLNTGVHAQRRTADCRVVWTRTTDGW